MKGRQPFKTVILLTSTLKPNGASEIAVRERRRQYERSIEHWMSLDDVRITGVVYCDNSSSELDWSRELAIKKGHSRVFEAIYCPDNNSLPGMHYGYQEMGLIDHAVETSRLISNSEYFVKITGRLLFPGLSRLLDSLPESFDACIDHRRAYKKERKSWTRYRARTQLMIFRTAIYKKLLMGKRRLMVENHVSHIEEFIPGILNPDKPCGADILYRWPVECRPSGVGGNGENFDSPRRKLKAMVQGCVRRIAPWYWL